MKKGKGGWGIVHLEILRDPNISYASKAIYAYLSGFCGCGNECFPNIETICKELGMTTATMYKHMKALEELGVVEKTRTRKGNLNNKVIYKITHTVKDSATPESDEVFNISICENFISRKNHKSKNSESNNNNILNNNNIITNNNSIKKERGKETNYQMIVDLYNEICVSFPKVTKISESRKRAIKARLKQYSVEDFKELFRKAEESDFLKGQSNLNWSANFDWLIRDSSMVKVLEGYYRNGEPKQFKNSDSRKVKNLYDNEEYEQLRRERQQKSVM